MKEIHVVGAAIRDGDRILAAQRSSRMSAPLKWEFAGGKVEPGESHHQALEREIREELGVKIRVKEHIATGSVEFPEKRILLHVYDSEIVDGIPSAKEHAQLQWLKIDEMESLDWAEPDVPACKAIRKLYG